MNNHRNSVLSRRRFLKKVCAGTTAVTSAWLLSGLPQVAYAGEMAEQPTCGVLIDLTRCTGCNSCALACKTANNLPNADVVPTALANDSYTYVDERQVSTPTGEVETRYVKRQCMHCLNAACVSACPAAAMYRSDEGPVVYRVDRCLGCRYCQVACPFGVPCFDWADGISPEIHKCWLCYERLREGQKPACVEDCPTGALRFGLREDLLAQAHAQIAFNPGHYIDHIFGEFEVGGTSMLYLSDVPFEDLGFPADLPRTAPPEETEKIMSKLPLVITGMTALMAGTAVWTHNKPTESDVDTVSEGIKTQPSGEQEE